MSRQRCEARVTQCSEQAPGACAVQLELRAVAVSVILYVDSPVTTPHMSSPLSSSLLTPRNGPEA